MAIREIIEKCHREPEAFRSLLDASIEKSRTENSIYNAFIRTYFSPENVPKLFDRIVQQKKDSPLFGTTFAVKDCMKVKMQPLSFGIYPPIEARASIHADVVQLFISAGATLLGSTNLDPACLDFYGDNPDYGKIINPLFKDRIPSGSSGGSAVAVAARFTDFALGTDFGGSVRAPAAACNIVGLKTSHNLFPRGGVIYLSEHMDSLGLFSKTVDDLMCIFEASVDDEYLVQPVRPPHFLIPSATELADLDEEVASDFNKYLERIRAFFSVQELDFPLGFEDCLEIRKVVASSDFFEVLNNLHLDQSILPESARAILTYERALAPSQKETALDLQKTMTAKAKAILDPYTFILTPTLPECPPTWNDVQLGRRSLPSRRINRFLAFANVCALPAISIPLEETVTKFPFSLQIIGAGHADYQLLHAAAEIQSTLSRQ